MIKTPDLIASLAANATPVRRLRPPVMRAACWLLLAAAVLTLLAINQGIRPDFAQRLREPAFVICMAASLLTGVLAAIAAFRFFPCRLSSSGCLTSATSAWFNGSTSDPTELAWVRPRVALQRSC